MAKKVTYRETWPDERLEELRVRWAAGDSPDDLAARFGCHRQGIYIRVWRHGYERAAGWEWNEARRRKLRRLVKAGTAHPAICKALGTTRHIVAKEMRRLGLRLRRKGQPVNYAEARRLFERGVTPYGIEVNLGIDMSSVYRRAQEEGWRRPKGFGTKWVPTPEEIEWLEANWFSTMTNEELADHFGVTQCTLNRMIVREKLDLPHRASSAALHTRFHKGSVRNITRIRQVARILAYRKEGMGPTEIGEALGISKSKVGHLQKDALRDGRAKPMKFKPAPEHRDLVVKGYRLGVTVETLRRMIRAPSTGTVIGLAGEGAKRIKHRNSRRLWFFLCAPDRLLAYEMAGGDPRKLLMAAYRRLELERRNDFVAIWRDYCEALAVIPSLLPSMDRADHGMTILDKEPLRPPFEWPDQANLVALKKPARAHGRARNAA